MKHIPQEKLKDIVQRMLVPGKGILAADESTETAAKRLEISGLENTLEHRRLFRDILLATDGVEEYMSGVILYPETLFQESSSGRPFKDILKEKGIVIGVKVDLGTFDFPGFPDEKLTSGIDGLRERLIQYREQGAEFTKFRTVIRIGEHIPTKECIHLNAITLGVYARMVQEEGMVPIVEPEVLLEGDHTIEKSEQVTREVLDHLFYEMKRLNVDITNVILKTSMVIDGSSHGIVSLPEVIAEKTLKMLSDVVPSEIAGVVFLSGGQESNQVLSNFAAITAQSSLPYRLAFSFARALQEPMLRIWKGDEVTTLHARKVFVSVLRCASEADTGVYTPIDTHFV